MRATLRRHRFALLLFPLLSFVWVGDTLFLPFDLSAFDVVLRLPHWKAEYEYEGVQQIILSDSPQAHYPERALKWRSARHGERIDFDPYILAGMPELSTGVGAFITSPFQLFTDVSEAIDWSTWLRLALAGLLMYGMLVVLEVNRTAAILGGVLWAFNLHQIAWLEYPQHLATQLWIPALFCFNYIMLKRGLSLESILGLLVVNALFFTSDYIQIVLYTYVAIGLFNTVYLAADTSLPARLRVIRWSAIHAVFILSALLLSPKVIVEAQFLDTGLRGLQSWRAKVTDLDVSAGLLLTTAKNMVPDIADFKRYFSPNYFGGLWGHGYEGKTFFGNVVVGSTYTSLAIFLTVPFSAAWLRRPGRRPFMLASGAVLLFAFGMIHKDPVLINAFNLIPKSGFGGYERYLTLITVFLCILSAVGVHVLTQLKPRTGQVLFAVVLVLAVLSPLLVGLIDPGLELSRMQYSFAVLGATGAAAIALACFKLWRYLAVLLIVVAITDLLVVTHDFNPRMRNERNFATTPTIRLLLQDPSVFRVAEVSTRHLYPPNVLQFYGLPSLNGYSTVAPRRYVEVIDRTLDDYYITPNGQLFFFSANIGVFRMLNTKYILSEKPIDDPRLRLARQAPGYQVYELRDPLPRAYCASHLLSYETEFGMLEDLSSIAARYDRPVALIGEARPPRALTRECVLSDLQVRLDGLSFTVSSDEPTYVFVSYNHFPGWKASTGAGNLPVTRANYSFIALPVEPGTHEVQLYFRDNVHLLFNILMTGLGLVVLAWCATRRNRSLTVWALALCGLVIVFWSLLEIPGIGNTSLPERPIVVEGLPPSYD